MSTHPNVILLLTLTPDGLTRKTYREILKDCGVAEDATDTDIKIGSREYHIRVMEEDYDESSQVSAKEGDIVVYDLVTYGYGEVIAWDKLTILKEELEAWTKNICEKFNCSYKIFVSANYW